MRAAAVMLIIGCSTPPPVGDAGITTDAGQVDAGAVDAGDVDAGAVAVDLNPFRQAARAELTAALQCFVAWVDGGAETPRITNAELSRAQAAAAEAEDALTIFDAPGVPFADGATFGPGSWRGGVRRGSVQRDDDGGLVIEVVVGRSAPDTTLLTASRRGHTYELRFDARGARDAGVTLGDGRLAIELGREASWTVATAVLAEWRAAGELQPISTRVSCARAETAAFVLASVTRDLDGDRLPDTFSAATWWSASGGRAEAAVRNGRQPTVAGRLVECWNEGLERRLKIASNGTTTLVEPADAGLARCPSPYDLATLDTPSVEPRVLRQTGAAYDGLHQQLTFARRPHKVLWVGAHPDDEGFYAAPLLGHLCRDLASDCTLLVVTDGATGSCRVPQGCPPDLGTFRRAEMVRAAAVYGARLVQLDWPPGPYPSETAVDLSRWGAAKGGTDGLVAAIRGVIDTAEPELIITFDPRHGSSCHAEHRVVSALAVSALRESGRTARVLFAEGYLPPPRFEDEKLLVFDATMPSSSSGSDAWRFVTMNLTVHPSQITPADLAAYERTPAVLRRVYLLDSDDARADPRYAVCANP